MQIGGTGAEVLKRLGRHYPAPLRREATHENREGGETRAEQPYRRPRVIGIGVKVQWVDNCAA